MPPRESLNTFPDQLLSLDYEASVGPLVIQQAPPPPPIPQAPPPPLLNDDDNNHQVNPSPTNNTTTTNTNNNNDTNNDNTTVVPRRHHHLHHHHHHWSNNNSDNTNTSSNTAAAAARRSSDVTQAVDPLSIDSTTTTSTHDHHRHNSNSNSSLLLHHRHPMIVNNRSNSSSPSFGNESMLSFGGPMPLSPSTSNVNNNNNNNNNTNHHVLTSVLDHDSTASDSDDDDDIVVVNMMRRRMLATSHPLPDLDTTQDSSSTNNSTVHDDDDFLYHHHTSTQQQQQQQQHDDQEVVLGSDDMLLLSENNHDGLDDGPLSPVRLFRGTVTEDEASSTSTQNSPIVVSPHPNVFASSLTSSPEPSSSSPGNLQWNLAFDGSTTTSSSHSSHHSNTNSNHNNLLRMSSTSTSNNNNGVSGNLELSFGPNTSVADLKYFAERGVIVPMLKALSTPRLKTLGTRMLADYAKMPHRRVAVASNRKILQFCMTTMMNSQEGPEWPAREYAVETIRSLTATEEGDSYLMSCPHLLLTLAHVARGEPFKPAATSTNANPPSPDPIHHSSTNSSNSTNSIMMNRRYHRSTSVSSQGSSLSSSSSSSSVVSMGFHTHPPHRSTSTISMDDGLLNLNNTNQQQQLNTESEVRRRLRRSYNNSTRAGVTMVGLASGKARLHACIAIMNLSCGKSNKIDIANIPDVLEAMRDVMLGTKPFLPSSVSSTSPKQIAEEARLKAATCIKNLSNADANDLSLLSTPRLVEALGHTAHMSFTNSSTATTCTTNACLALMNLSINKANKHRVFRTRGVMDALIAVISNTAVTANTNGNGKCVNTEARIKACSALSNLAIGYDNKIPMFQYPGFVDAILHVIDTDSGEARTKACSILWSFAAEMKNQVPVVERGDILPTLVRVAEEDHSTEARFKCVAALTLLAESLENAVPLLESGALHPLMDILHEAGPDPTQWKGQTASWCVGFLMNMAQSDDAVPSLRESGVVELLAPLLTLDHYQSLKAAMAVTFVCRFDKDDETYDLLRKTENVIPKITTLLHNTLSGRGGHGYKYGVFTLRSSVGCISSLASGPEFMKERIATPLVFESLLRVISDFCVNGGTPGAIVGGGKDDALSATLAIRALQSLTAHLIPIPGCSALPFTPSMDQSLIVALQSLIQKSNPHPDISDHTISLANDASLRIQKSQELVASGKPLQDGIILNNGNYYSTPCTPTTPSCSPSLLNASMTNGSPNSNNSNSNNTNNANTNSSSISNNNCMMSHTIVQTLAQSCCGLPTFGESHTTVDDLPFDMNNHSNNSNTSSNDGGCWLPSYSILSNNFVAGSPNTSTTDVLENDKNKNSNNNDEKVAALPVLLDNTTIMTSSLPTTSSASGISNGNTSLPADYVVDMCDSSSSSTSSSSNSFLMMDEQEQPVRTFLMTDAKTGRRFAVPIDPSGGRSFTDNRVWCFRRGRFCRPGESPDPNFRWTEDLQMAYLATLNNETNSNNNNANNNSNTSPNANGLFGQQ